MKKIFSFKMMCILVLGLMCSAVSKADVPEFPLNGLNLLEMGNGTGTVTYNAGTKTISYNFVDPGDPEVLVFGFAGWTWAPGTVDLSAYSSIQFTFDPQFAKAGDIALEVKYAADDLPVTIQSNNQTTQFFQHVLSPSKKAAVEYVRIMSKTSGQIVLEGITASPAGRLELSFLDPRFLDEWNDNNVWDADEKTVYFTQTDGEDAHFGWSYKNDDHIEFSEYDYLELDFEILSGCISGVYLETRYSNEDGSDAGSGAIRKGAYSTTGKAYVKLNKNFPYFRNVLIHVSEKGDVKLNSVALVAGQIPGEGEDEGRRELSFTDPRFLYEWNDNNVWDADEKTVYFTQTDSQDAHFGWSYKGDDNIEFEEYDYVELDFEILSGCESGVYLETRYSNEDGSDAGSGAIRKGAYSTTGKAYVKLNKNFPYFRNVLIQVSEYGDVRLNSVTLVAGEIPGEGGDEGRHELSFTDPRFLYEWLDGNVWDSDENVVYFTEPGPGSHFGWSYKGDDNIEFEGYDYVELDFEILYGCESGVYLEIHYSDENGGEAPIVSQGEHSTNGKAYALLDNAYPYLRNVYIKVDEEGDVRLNSVALVAGEIPEGTGIKDISAKGKVFVLNNTLFIEGYPSTAKVSIYNLVGQSVGNGKLTSGVYVVSVQVDGKSYKHKVLAK